MFACRIHKRDPREGLNGAAWRRERSTNADKIAAREAPRIAGNRGANESISRDHGRGDNRAAVWSRKVVYEARREKDVLRGPEGTGI